MVEKIRTKDKKKFLEPKEKEKGEKKRKDSVGQLIHVLTFFLKR
jgi:hypothetical protein